MWSKVDVRVSKIDIIIEIGIYIGNGVADMTGF